MNKTLTTSEVSDPLFITREWLYRDNTLRVEGNLTPNDSETVVVLNLFDPQSYFMSLLLENFRKSGIKTDSITYFSKTPVNAIEIVSIERPYDSVLVNLNKISDNLSAEMVLYALAEKSGGIPASASNGIRLIDSLIRISGNNPADYVIADGSGVSHYNLISVELICNILKYFYFYHYPEYQKLFYSFPIAGVDGTLKSRMKKSSAENNVHAKTGTLSGVSSLSGYLTARQGNQLVFSIIIQNFTGSSSIARYYQDTICRILTE
jgi:serine-type D-Ala-D-Ala carboxypeptidase/endopeptidase (penicillin-binding protein 4)